MIIRVTCQNSSSKRRDVHRQVTKGHDMSRHIIQGHEVLRYVTQTAGENASIRSNGSLFQFLSSHSHQSTLSHLELGHTWRELNDTNYFDAIAYDGSAVKFSVDECKNDILPWLYVGLKINGDLYPLKAVRGFERGAPGMVFRIFAEECSHLETVCERISEISRKMGAVEAVYTKCLEEIKKREKNPDLFDLLFLLYEGELANISAYDYRSIIVLLLKSFLEPHLHDLFYIDAEEKSVAAEKALLAEVEGENDETEIIWEESVAYFGAFNQFISLG
ncbi:hypothetical protein Q3G72_025821 [Acer saccharum]|nr:hypothetical protein Q3G72_025821 [Acer saccharum]